MQFVAFDLETTGIDPFKDIPVSYAFVGGDLRIVEYCNPGRSIPSGATAIHKITDSMVSNATPIDSAIEFVIESLHTIWLQGDIICGMNVSYDLTMVATLARRLGLEFGMGPVVDILVLDRHYDKWRKGSRNLTAMCNHYGVSLDNAHSAEFDCKATLDILSAMRERYEFGFSLKGNEQLRAWYRDWLKGYSEYLVKQGKEPIPKGRYEWPVHSEDN